LERRQFLSNSVRMHNKLRRTGNHSELYIKDAMPHGGFHPAPEDAAMAWDVRHFVDRIWGGRLAL
jgi:monoterpene epsilon-lactone hydrolase